MDTPHDDGYQDPVDDAERYLRLSDVSDEPDRDEGRKPRVRPPKWLRPMKRLPSPGRMRLLGVAVLLVALLSVGSLIASHLQQEDAGRQAMACSTALRALTDALTARRAQEETTRSGLDMDTLRAADPAAAKRIDDLLDQDAPAVDGCDSRPGDHAASMNRKAAAVRKGTRDLAALTERATARTGAYETRRAQERFDDTLARAERLSASIDPDTLDVPYIKTRLDQEIADARALPRTASAQDLEQQADTLDNLMGQLGAPAPDTKGTEEEHAAEQ